MAFSNYPNLGVLLFNRLRKTFDSLSHNKLAFFILASLGFALFGQALFSGPVFDDNAFIFNSKRLIAAPNPWVFWINGNSFTRSWPLSFSLLWSFYKLFGDHYFFYNLINLLLHIANAFLIYKISHQYYRKMALLGSVIFLIHPMQIETVCWIFQFKTVLATLLALLSLQVLIKYKFAPSKKKIALSLFLFWLSLQTKPVAVLLPLFYFFFIPKNLTLTPIKKHIPSILFSILMLSSISTTIKGVLYDRYEYRQRTEFHEGDGVALYIIERFENFIMSPTSIFKSSKHSKLPRIEKNSIEVSHIEEKQNNTFNQNGEKAVKVNVPRNSQNIKNEISNNEVTLCSYDITRIIECRESINELIETNSFNDATALMRMDYDLTKDSFYLDFASYKIFSKMGNLNRAENHLMSAIRKEPHLLRMQRHLFYFLFNNKRLNQIKQLVTSHKPNLHFLYLFKIHTDDMSDFHPEKKLAIRHLNKYTFSPIPQITHNDLKSRLRYLDRLFSRYQLIDIRELKYLVENATNAFTIRNINSYFKKIRKINSKRVDRLYVDFNMKFLSNYKLAQFIYQRYSDDPSWGYSMFTLSMQAKKFSLTAQVLKKHTHLYSLLFRDREKTLLYLLSGENIPKSHISKDNYVFFQSISNHLFQLGKIEQAITIQHHLFKVRPHDMPLYFINELIKRKDYEHVEKLTKSYLQVNPEAKTKINKLVPIQEDSLIKSIVLKIKPPFALKNFAFYITHFLLPLQNSLVYPGVTFPWLRIAISALVFLLIFKFKLFSLGALFVLSILPVIGIYYVPYMKFSPSADHWAYLAIAPLALLLTHLLSLLNYKRTGLVLTLLFTFLILIHSLIYIPIFNHEIHVLKHAMKVAPDQYSLYMELSSKYSKKGKYLEAKAILEKGLKRESLKENGHLRHQLQVTNQSIDKQPQ